MKLEEIRDICKTIVVNKNDTLSSVDYNDRWQLESVSDTETKHFFVVNPEDFE